MHTHVSLNAQLLPHEDARINAVSNLTLYGRGVWTTIAVHRATPFLWQGHWARIVAHGAHIGVDVSSLNEFEVRAQLDRLIAHNKVTEGRARLSLLARTRGGAWTSNDDTRPRDTSDDAQTDALIITGDFRPAPDEGIALTVSPHRANTRSPLAGVKTTNYLDHILASEEARARHFNEAVRLNERGEIVSATMANLFWAKDGALHTPALPCGALDGTTRALVLQLAGELTVPVVEGAYDLAHLGDADEIFLTSANLGVAFCSAFDFRRYTLPAGSITIRLREALRQRTLQS